MRPFADRLRSHWSEYLMEAAGLGLFMISAAAVTAGFEYPRSPLHAAVSDSVVRRVLIGICMGLTAVAIIYSPWGKQSGAHLNPAVTLTFYRLGKIEGGDAAWYVLAQSAGGFVGLWMAGIALGPILGHPAVNYVVTVPGEAGLAAAFLAETAISFGLMLTVLFLSNHRTFAPVTGLAAGGLVAVYIGIEAPLSGMSMNPARTLASAIPADLWTAFWLYVTAPMGGMLLAAECFLRTKGPGQVYCAKLDHHGRARCIFRCRYGELPGRGAGRLRSAEP